MICHAISNRHSGPQDIIFKHGHPPLQPWHIVVAQHHKAGIIKAFAEDTKWTIRLKGRQYYLVSDKQSVRIPVGEKILEMTWDRAQEIIKGKAKKSPARKKKA